MAMNNSEETKPELMNLFWTSAGIVPGAGAISPHDFESRVKSVAKAGFCGTGLWHADLEHLQVHHSLSEIDSILRDNGIKYLELEFLTDWFVDGARRWESDNLRKRLLEASAALGAKHIKIGDFYSTTSEMSRLIDEFGALCQEAQTFDATIGFEFMASSMLPSLQGALELIEAVNAPNGGLIIDIVQVNFLKIPLSEVARVPAERLIGVELNDGALVGSPLHDSKRDRRWCGEGDFDVTGFVKAIKATGFDGPWAVEVMSPELAALPLDTINETAFQTSMRYLEACG